MSITDSVEPGMYARFTRRVQAVYVDLMIFLSFSTAALLIAVNFESDNIRRAIGAAFVLGWFLYEPLLVSLTGSTLGHLYCNIRVVDARHGGNIGFFRAFSRAVIKTFLSWYSFAVMTATSRHQALHDVITRSSVQIRDAASKTAPLRRGTRTSAGRHPLTYASRSRNCLLLGGVCLRYGIR